MKLLFVGFATLDIYPDGNKIPGGAAGGMSLNAKTLGVDSWLLAPIGQDDNGLYYHQTLSRRGINTSLCPDCPSNPTCIITDPFGASYKRDWSDHGARDYLLKIDPTQLPFTNFDGIVFANTIQVFVDLLTPYVPAEIPIFYIPGPQTVIRPDTINTDLLNKATIVFGNSEESTNILKLEPLHLGTKLVVITRGDKGADVYTLTDQRHFPAPIITNAVDATGAGDCYTLGFIVEYLKSKDIDKAIQSANKLASQIIGKQGVLL